MTTTNANENKNAAIESNIETEMPVFENLNYDPVDDQMMSENEDDASFKNIDMACDMVNNAVKKRNDDIAKAKQEDENRKKRSQDEILENQRIANRNACLERAKAARKARKKMAKNITFIMSVISATCSTVVISILIWMTLDISEWFFAGIAGAIGMMNTLIHTYIYRYIREEIFRK